MLKVKELGCWRLSEETMESITGSTKWDIFVVYIVLCTVFILFCCVCVIFMFWCCPARDPSGGAALASGGGRNATLCDIPECSPIADSLVMEQIL